RVERRQRLAGEIREEVHPMGRDPVLGQRELRLVGHGPILNGFAWNAARFREPPAARSKRLATRKANRLADAQRVYLQTLSTTPGGRRHVEASTPAGCACSPTSRSAFRAKAAASVRLSALNREAAVDHDRRPC